MKLNSLFLGNYLAVAFLLTSAVSAQTEVLTVQGTLPRFNYRAIRQLALVFARQQRALEVGWSIQRGGDRVYSSCAFR